MYIHTYTDTYTAYTTFRIGCCEHGDEFSDSIKSGKFLKIAE
jgi:hypothetical protein